MIGREPRVCAPPPALKWNDPQIVLLHLGNKLFELLAGLKLRNALGRDLDRLSRFRVHPHSCLAHGCPERSETYQSHLLTLAHGVTNRIQSCLQGRSCLFLAQLCTLRNRCN